MGINVNVNPKKLDEFSDYVNQFSAGIRQECNTLRDAVEELGQKTDAENMSSIRNMLRDVEDILQRAQPTFAAISSDANGYSVYLKKLRAISGNG